MTSREKLKRAHPECDAAHLYELYKSLCPSSFGYLADPDYCDNYEDACERCWDREIDEQGKLNDVVHEALSLNRGIGEDELREAVDCLTKEFGKSTSNKVGSIEIGVEVKNCRTCERGDRGTEVLYLCDEKLCGDACPNQDCRHTTDIHHAKNFVRRHSYWEEIDREDWTKPMEEFE